MSKDNWGSSLVCFLLGTAVGVAAALLYAPQEGKETRRFLGDKASEYKDKASDLTSNVAQTAKDKLGKATDHIQDMVGRGQKAANNSIDAAADMAHAGVSRIS